MEKVHKLLNEKGRDVFTATPETSVKEAVKFMVDRHVGGLVVLKDGRPGGMFTERDVMTKVVLNCQDPATCTVGEVMSGDVVFVTPESSVGEAMAIMTSRRCRHLPVLEEGKLAGLVSIGDCTRWVSQHQDFTIKHLTNYIADKYPS
jgi:CBS domain-containing protein